MDNHSAFQFFGSESQFSSEYYQVLITTHLTTPKG